MSDRLRQIIARFDRELLAFFERSGPRRSAEALLCTVQIVEAAFFWPFRVLFGKPAQFFLDQRAARVARRK